MRSINRRFLRVRSESPNLGDYIVLEKTVRNQRFSRRVIQKAFDAFIAPDDYENSDRSLLLHFLYESSLRPEDDIK